MRRGRLRTARPRRRGGRLPQLRRYPVSGLVHPAGRDLNPEQHAHHGRGPLRRHVPIAGHQHRRGIEHRTVAHRSRIRAGLRLRERDRPAAWARQPRQQPLGHRPDRLHVDDLRPPRLYGIRAVQPGPAAAALRRRVRGLRLARIRIPGQTLPRMPRLPAPHAVLPALPLGLLPRPPRLLRPDRLPSTSAYPNRTSLAPAAVPAPLSAAPAHGSAPAPPPGPPAARQARCPWPPPQHAAGRRAHADHQARQAGRGHRAQAESMFNLH